MNEDHIPLALLAYPTGGHPAGWLKSSAPRDASTNIDYQRWLASEAERGLFDLFFLADTAGAKTDKLNVHTRNPSYMSVFEPITLLAALAGSTKNIGLGATASTSFYEPYNLARLFASVDHLSHGRAAWNVVTTANDFSARNFGHDKLPPHNERYLRAHEFFKVVESLWDTWEDDAFVYDKESCTTFDPAKFHVTDHAGKYFQVYGGLNIKRTPQGRPVVIQAGSSEEGKNFAAETAEVVFASDSTLAAAQRFYSDLKRRVAGFGRKPESMKILAGLSVVVGESEAEAQDKYQELQNLIHPDVGRMRLGQDLEADLSGVALDEPVPEHLIPKKANFHQGYFNQIVEMIRTKNLSLRQLYSSYERGKVTVCGTAPQIVDHMTEWVSQKATDGFMLTFHVLPDDLTAFVDKVVPEMQRRGVYRTEYSGTTLRENLGLAWPESQHASGRT